MSGSRAGSSRMTVKELSQVYVLQREIDYYDRKIDELRAKRTAISAPGFDKEPNGRNDSPGRENKIETLTAEIIDLEELMRLHRQQRVIEHQRLERYIGGVDDPTVRQIMRLRFEELLSWRDVAARMGPCYTEDQLKKMLYRYVEKHDDQTEETVTGEG